jgi:hypothetical protein
LEDVEDFDKEKRLEYEHKVSERERMEKVAERRATEAV